MVSSLTALGNRPYGTFMYVVIHHWSTFSSFPQSQVDSSLNRGRGHWHVVSREVMLLHRNKETDTWVALLSTICYSQPTVTFLYKSIHLLPLPSCCCHLVVYPLWSNLLTLCVHHTYHISLLSTLYSTNKLPNWRMIFIDNTENLNRKAMNYQQVIATTTSKERRRPGWNHYMRAGLGYRLCPISFSHNSNVSHRRMYAQFGTITDCWNNWYEYCHCLDRLPKGQIVAYTSPITNSALIRCCVDYTQVL